MKQTESGKIKILATTDVHGAIFSHDFINNEEMSGSLSRFSSYIKQQKNNFDGELLILDNGDYIQGQPTVYYYNFEDTTSVHLGARVLNYLGVDAASVGNHDIETGHSVYDRIRKGFNFPWLAANAVDENTGSPYFEPYAVFTKGKLKVAVLGLITPGIPNWLPPDIYSGMKFLDMKETAKKWIKIIEEKEKPDLVIGLFHAGLDYTYNKRTRDTPLNENASMIVAQDVPGFDIVISGHDHQIYNNFVVNTAGDSVLVVNPKSSANYTADIEVDYSFIDGKLSKKITTKMVELKDFENDPEFEQKFADDFEKVDNYVSKEIGTIKNELDAKQVLWGNSAFVDFIHQVQLDISKADISLTSPLSLSTCIGPGKIYVRDLFKLYRYENLLYTMELSGQEIKDFLEYSASLWFNTMSSENDYLLNYELDSSGALVESERYAGLPKLKEPYFNFSSASGINYQIDITKEIGKRLTVLSMTNGEPFSLTKRYRVAINSYRGNGGGGHLIEGCGIKKSDLEKRIIHSTQKDLRYYVMKWIEEKGDVEVEKWQNWEIIPKEFVDKAKGREYEMLFSKKRQ